MSYKSFEETLKMSDEEWNVYKKTLTEEQLFDLAVEGLDHVQLSLDSIAESIDTTLDEALKDHQPSKDAATELLAKFRT